MKALRIFMGLFLCLSIMFIVSCAPSESDARREALSLIEKYSKDGIKLISIRKTNGITSGSRYSLEYEAVVEYLRDGKIDERLGSNPWRLSDPSDRYDFGYVSVRKGERRTFQGTFRFEKTENGWRL